MSDLIDKAVTDLNAKIGSSFDGCAKFVIEEEGTIIMDEAGARPGDDPADVTLTADADTFRKLLEGEIDPTTAFMSGQLKVDGDMGQAMKLAAIL